MVKRTASGISRSADGSSLPGAGGSPARLSRGLLVAILALMLALGLRALSSASHIAMGAAATAAPIATRTPKACHVCGDDPAPAPVVRAVMYWMNGCPHCEDVIANVLPALHDKYASTFELKMVEVRDQEDVEALYRVAAAYGIPKDRTGVPFVIIGDQVLIGSDEVRTRLPDLIAGYLADGGVDWPAGLALTEAVAPASPTTSQTSAGPVEQPTSVPALPAKRSNGFVLALLVMALMAAAVIYSLAALVAGRTVSMPGWTDWIIPALLFVGMVVAGYLTYVEASSATASCGPIGDCNAVQQSRYARLFGVLPVGVLGLFGYLGLLGSWLVRKLLPRFEKAAATCFWGMAFFAVIFSLYLTYLEPFVIRAVCLWCLTSALIAASLLFMGTAPALRALAPSGEQ